MGCVGAVRVVLWRARGRESSGAPCTPLRRLGCWPSRPRRPPPPPSKPRLCAWLSWFAAAPPRPFPARLATLGPRGRGGHASGIGGALPAKPGNFMPPRFRLWLVSPGPDAGEPPGRRTGGAGLAWDARCHTGGIVRPASTPSLINGGIGGPGRGRRAAGAAAAGARWSSLQHPRPRRRPPARLARCGGLAWAGGHLRGRSLGAAAAPTGSASLRRFRALRARLGGLCGAPSLP